MGTMLLIVLFVTLCLSVFAMLALVTANRDYQLTEKTMGHMASYYEAECAVQEYLSQIDDRVITYGKNLSELEAALYALEAVQTLTLEEDKGQLCYEVAYEPNQKIVVVLTLFLEPTQGRRYQVESYCVVPQDTPLYEASEPLLSDMIIE